MVSSDRYPQRAAAAALRFELDLGHGLVDPFDVAARLGIELVRFPVADGSIEGMYRPDGGGYIFVNSQAAFVRQRFTAAHEIGHHRLHGGQAFVESSLDEPDDWEANCFAEAFLVDPVGVRRLLTEVEHDVPRMVAVTCDAYWVSQSAAAIILRHLGLIAQPELDGFLGQSWTYASLLRQYGLEPRPEARRNETQLPSQFRERTLGLLKAGQLSSERVASMLGVEPAELSGFVSAEESDPLGRSLLADFPDSLE